MKRIFLVLLLAISAVGCGDRSTPSGGGGTSIAAATAPFLFQALVTAQSVPPPGQIPVQVILEYVDPGGDLNGGTVFYSINGGSYTPKPLSASNATTKTTTLPFTIFVENPIIGNIPIRFFVKDRQAVQSNTVTAFLSQPPSL